MQALKDFIRDNNKLAGGILVAVGLTVIVVNFVVGTSTLHTVINCILGAGIISFGAIIAIKGIY